MPVQKVFISYSWSSPEHETWVLDLATDLRESGIDAILDKWDLKEGDEANAFMEKMVTDVDIQKVIIVSDKTYAEKSNSRTGGAGTEAQIISSEIFAKQDQSKFVALVIEKDDDGNSYLPTYYTSRIFIDFSDPSRFTESFEQLLRWATDKPMHKKPSLGALPTYLTDEAAKITISTNAAHSRSIDALTNSKPHAFPSVKEYFELFTTEIEKFRLADDVDPASEEIMNNLDSFTPYRNEILEMIKSVARYTEEQRYENILHSFFERLIIYFDPPEVVSSYQDTDFDNFKFFADELFLHACSILIDEGRYDLFATLTEKPYYQKRNADFGRDPLVSFTIFRHYLKLFEIRKQKLNLNRTSLHADLLHNRAASTGVVFDKLMQTDFILFIKGEISKSDEYSNWWPETLVYLSHMHRAFEIFERSRSKKYFDTVKVLLDVKSKSEIDDLLTKFKSDERSLPRWQHRSISPSALLGFQNLCTLP